MAQSVKTASFLIVWSVISLERKAVIYVQLVIFTIPLTNIVLTAMVITMQLYARNVMYLEIAKRVTGVTGLELTALKNRDNVCNVIRLIVLLVISNQETVNNVNKDSY